MKLFLASEAKNPLNFKKLTDFVGGFAGKTLVYIPTAANGESFYGSWKQESSTWLLIQTLGAKVLPVVLEEQTTEEVMEKLTATNIIWMAGGATGYLMYWLRRHGLDKTLPKLLAKNKVYIGSSAGSMVASRSLSVCEWYLHENEQGAGFIPGLGLVDFEVYPHFQTDQLEQIKKLRQKNQTGMPLYLLKDGEAVLVDGFKIKVFGEERRI
ncbi:MAG: Type 1 glutamine amidotransferase-like domain-containing protein [Patescibacteria group bacterium]